MSSLATCLKKAGKGVSASDATFMKESMAEYLAEGKPKAEATNLAVVDYINSVSDQRKALESEISELGGYVEPSPYDPKVLVDEIITAKLEAQKAVVEKQAKSEAKAKAKTKVVTKPAKSEKAPTPKKPKVAKEDELVAVGTSNDKSDPDPSKSALEGSLREGDLSKVLGSLSKGTQDPILSQLVNMILPHLPETQINVISHGDKLPRWMVDKEVTDFNNSRAITAQLKDGSIAIFLKDTSFTNNAMSEETVVHEALHAATMALFAKKDKSAKLKKSLERMDGLLSTVSERVAKKVKDGTATEYEASLQSHVSLNNLEEFMAWGLTNQRFQKYLSSIKIKKVSAWTKFVEALADMFNAGPESHNALFELFDSTSQVLEADFVAHIKGQKRMTRLTNGDRVTRAQDIPLIEVEELEYTNEFEEYFRRSDGQNQDNGRTLEGKVPKEGWAKATSVRRSDGTPATVFRGSDVTLETTHFKNSALGYATKNASASLGVWFTNKKDDAAIYGPVSEFNLDLRNPKVIHGADIDAFDSPREAVEYRKKLIAEGYDGLILDMSSDGGPAQIVVFSPDVVIPKGTPSTAPSVQNFADDIPVVDLSAEVAAGEKTSSFLRAESTSQETFDLKQLSDQVKALEFQRDNRLDIKAGRKLKEVTGQIRTLQHKIDGKRKNDPYFKDDAGSLQQTIDRISAKPKGMMTLRERTSQWMEEHSFGWSDVRMKFGRYVTSDLKAVEVMDADQPGGRKEGFNSATVLSAFSKNANVAAGVIINQFGLKMENKMLVVDQNQLGLEPILEPVAKLGQKYLRLWEAYILVKRSERLIAEGKENFVLDKDIQQVKDAVESRPNLKSLFDGTIEQYSELNKSVLNIAIEAGYINSEDAFGGLSVYNPRTKVTKLRKGGNQFALSSREALETKYPASEGYEILTRPGWFNDDYVPFNRIDEGNKKTKGLGAPGKIGQVRKGVVGLKGGVGKIPVLENMVKNISFLVNGSMKTVAMKQIVDLALDVAVESIKEEGTAPIIDAATARRIATETGVDLKTLPVAERQRWMRMMSASLPMSADTVVVFEEGRPKHYTVTDPDLLGALKAVGPNQVKTLLKVIGFPTRVLSGAITKMPSFIVKNLVRELQNAFVINEKGSINPLVTLGKGLKNFTSLLNVAQPEMLAMTAMGAVSFNSYYKSAPTDVRARLLKMGVNKSATRRIIESPISGAKKFWDFYMRVAMATEHANRLTLRQDYIKDRTSKLDASKVKKGSAAYKKYVSRIESEANYQGLSVLNFSRRGEGLLADVLMATMPFVNPRIQGLSRLSQGAKSNPKAMMVKASLLAGAAIMLSAWNWGENEEEMKKLKEEDKDLWYHFWLKNDDGTKDHYRIPKGFEIGQVAGTLPERIIEQFVTDQPEPVSKGFLRFLQTTFGLSYPQIIKPALEVGVNRDFFRQRPIIGFGQMMGAPQDQYDVWTSKVLIDIAKAMPASAPDWAKSPKKLQHLFRGYLGSAGSLALEMSNEVYEMTGNAPDAPTKQTSQQYLIRDFYKGNTETPSKYLTRFYEMLDESGEVARQLKVAKEVKDPRYSSRDRQENQTDLRGREYVRGR